MKAFAKHISEGRTLARPSILAGEYAASYLGDVCALNLCAVVERRRNWPPRVDLSEFIAATEGKGRRELLLACLAEFANLPVQTFIRLHTNAQFSSAFDQTTASEEALLASANNDCWTVRLRFCNKCVEHDQAVVGRSFYRASHQLPGHFWCTEHGHEQLHETPLGEIAWEYAPEQWLGSCTAVGRPWEEMFADEQEQISSYLKRAEALARSIQSALPDPSWTVDHEVTDHRRPAGVLLSGRVWTCYPQWWLVMIDPAWRRKESMPSEPIHIRANDAAFWVLAERWR